MSNNLSHYPLRNNRRRKRKKQVQRSCKPFYQDWLDDIRQEGMQIVEEIMDIFTNYDIKTEVIVASIRHPIHVIDAA